MHSTSWAGQRPRRWMVRCRYGQGSASPPIDHGEANNGHMPQFLLNEPAASVLNSLAEALDQMNIGIILLDRYMRVRFVNRRQIEMFDLPPALLAAKPCFRD